jgi:hypothetical protein
MVVLTFFVVIPRFAAGKNATQWAPMTNFSSTATHYALATIIASTATLLLVQSLTGAATKRQPFG